MSLLTTTALSVSLGGARILADVELRVGAGEVVGLIGPNGAGKTTLLRAMAGLLPLDDGEIRIAGRPLSRIVRRERARMVAYLPQGGEHHWAVTVETLVMLGRLPHRGPWRGPSAADRAAVARALDVCDVARFRHRPLGRLSGGERARVMLARALAGEPELLLADEPVAGLDPAHQLDVMATLRVRAAAGTGVVVVMHDLTLAARHCDRLALLHDGRLVAQDIPAAILTAGRLADCYGIRAYHGVVDGSAVIVPLARTGAPDGPG